MPEYCRLAATAAQNESGYLDEQAATMLKHIKSPEKGVRWDNTLQKCIPRQKQGS